MQPRVEHIRLHRPTHTVAGTPRRAIPAGLPPDLPPDLPPPLPPPPPPPLPPYAGGNGAVLARQTTSCGGVLGGVAPEAGCIVAELQAAQQAAQMPAGFPSLTLTPNPNPNPNPNHNPNPNPDPNPNLNQVHAAHAGGAIRLVADDDGAPRGTHALLARDGARRA